MQPLTQRQYQARFADSGLTGNKGDLPASLLRLPPAREHELEFLTPADERCQPCAVQRLEPAFSVAFPEDAPSPHRFRETLERGWRERGELEQIADEAPRPIGYDHRAGLGEPLQPRRQVRRLSCDASLLRLARADKIADDHQPGGDSNARVERLASGCVELSDAFDQRQAGPDRTFGVIFVGLRIAKVDEHAVAHEFGDVAATCADDILDLRVIRTQEFLQIFWIKAGGESCRAHEVAKHHRELPPLGVIREPLGQARRLTPSPRASNGIEEFPPVADGQDSDLL